MPSSQLIVPASAHAAASLQARQQNSLAALAAQSRFPANFVWGVATSAFQIEGGATEGGRGPSIWDTFCEQPGVIADASNGLTACDHYHRWATDLDLIRDLNVNAYRFSASWSRVRPTGAGAWNEEGLAFYDRLVDGLLARGLQAHLTLNHWDLPDALQATGGWQNRDTVHRFVEYAERMAARLGDRLSTIATHNEPWVMATLGHDSGIFAPGVKSPAAAAQVAHHLLLSHGMALQALRDAGCRSELGIVLNQAPMQPATNTAEDAAKARLEDGRLVRWYMDPLFRGHYPEDVLAALGDAAPKVQPGDMELIAQPLDWLGINYYSRGVTSANDSWKNEQSGLPLTDMGWEVYPEGLTELLLRLKRDYAVPPLCITENGGAFKDELKDGRVDDHARTDYLVRHIAAVAEAMRQGVTMKGYMVWSLLDNFEWASGYEKRFGIVHVDYASQARTLKDSALWYRSFLHDQRQQHAAAPTTPTTPTTPNGAKD